MYQSLTIQQLTTATVYKLVAIGSLFSCVPVFFVIGLLSAMGNGSVQWNGQGLMGMKALFFSPVIGLVVALMVTVFMGTMLSLGLWIFSLLRPIQLHFFENP